jgi:hypothetical protein
MYLPATVQNEYQQQVTAQHSCLPFNFEDHHHTRGSFFIKKRLQPVHLK